MYSLIVGNRSYEVFVDEVEGRLLVAIEGQLFDVSVRDEWALAPRTRLPSAPHSTVELPVKAPMPGLIIAVHVAEGDTVAAGARLLTLEAMKMENEIIALRDGRISKVLVKPSQKVGHGDLLVVIA